MTSIPSWARVGAKVVCVDNSYVTDLLVVGAVYTIEGPGMYRDTIVLVGVCAGSRERGMLISRFRPLITQQDDIEAHFRALLDVPADEREAA